MAKNPLGLHVQAQGKGFDRPTLLNHVKRADYITCSVLDDQQLAIDLNIPYGVFRAYSFEPAPGSNIDSSAKMAFAEISAWVATHPGGRNILYNVNCEPEWSKARNDLYAKMIEISANYPGGPIGLVVGNYGSGTIKSGQGSDPNWWATPEAENLLRTLHKYRDVKLPNGSYAFVLGVHEYTGIHPWIAVNGAEKRLNPLWHERPTTIDWNKAQWHLGRAAQGIVAACVKFGIQPPRMLITECLIDDMDDVAYTFGSRASGNTGLKTTFGVGKKARGWRSLIPQWKEWYAGHDVEGGGLYAEMLAWTWETIYKPLGFVIGMNAYTWGSTGDWETFRVDNAPGYISKIEAYSTTPTVPPVEPPPPQPVTTAPDPKSPLWYKTKAHTYGDKVNVRADNTEASADLGDFQASAPGEDVMMIYRPGEDYQPFMRGDLRGHVSARFVVRGLPPMPTKEDKRWQEYTARPSGASADVRDWANGVARRLFTLQVGVTPIQHIPKSALTPTERAYVGDWNIVKNGDVVGYAPPNVALDPVVVNPPLETVPVEIKRLADLVRKEQELLALQSKWLATTIAMSQIVRQIDGVGAIYDQAANLLQGAVELLSEQTEALTKLTNPNKETLQ